MLKHSLSQIRSSLTNHENTLCEWSVILIKTTVPRQLKNNNDKTLEKHIPCSFPTSLMELELLVFASCWPHHRKICKVSYTTTDEWSNSVCNAFPLQHLPSLETGSLNLIKASSQIFASRDDKRWNSISSPGRRLCLKVCISTTVAAFFTFKYYTVVICEPLYLIYISVS